MCSIAQIADRERGVSHTLCLYLSHGRDSPIDLSHTHTQLIHTLSSTYLGPGLFCEYMAQKRDQTVTLFPACRRPALTGSVPGPARLSRALPLPKRHAAGPAHASGTPDKHSRHRRARLPSPPRWRCRRDIERDLGLNSSSCGQRHDDTDR